MNESHWLASVALGLAVVMVSAKLAGELAVRLGQVAVLGELLAGIVLGNLPGSHWIAWIASDSGIDIVAQLGSLVLLFEVGLALTVRDVFRVGGAAVAVAVLGSACSLGFGSLVTAALRPAEPIGVTVFTGAALAATSIGITARVLRDLSRVDTREARIVLGAALIDDVLGLILLATVAGWMASADGGPGRAPWVTVSWIALKALAFFTGAFVVGIPLARWLFKVAPRLRTSGAQVAAGLAFCFLLSWSADILGLAPIVGAFIAGLILEEAHSAGFVARGERSLAELVQPVSSFLVPVFFVLAGMRADLRALAQPGALALAGALIVAAVAGKLACALGVRRASRLVVAAGMMPRGEVALIYASLGHSTAVAGKPLLEQPAYAAILLVVVATTLLTPPALKWSLRPTRHRDQGA